MTVSKTPKALLLIVILAMAVGAVVSGCGGGGSSTTESTAEEAPPPAAKEGGAEEEPPAKEEEEEGGGESAAGGEGKAIFSANCASCHTLKAAGASGEVGPNLDELKPDEATVEKQVINGGGVMPAFKGTLDSNEIKEVAAYVSSEAGK